MTQQTTPDFDARWKAWLEHGAAADRATRRMMAIVLPVMALVAILLYVKFGR